VVTFGSRAETQRVDLLLTATASCLWRLHQTPGHWEMSAL